MVIRKREEKAPEVTVDDVARTLRTNGVELFKERAGMPLNQAQRNLEGKTHYVDDKTLASFKARIHSVSIMDEGLILGMVESIQAGPNEESGRVYRPVFFDVFGNEVYKPSIEESQKSLKSAQAEFWKQAEEIDAVQATIDGLKAKQKALQDEANALGAIIEELE